MTSSLLAPAYQVTLGNQRWTTQATAVAVTLEAAPLVDRARVTFPAAAPVEAGPGDPAVVELDAGSGDGPVAVLTGTVRAVAREARSVVVECVDAGATLASYRPATTFEQTTAASVVRALCADVGVDVGAVDTGPSLAAYVADPTRSALDHIARLAGFGGALATVDGDGALATQVVDGSQPDVALRFDREIVRLDQRKVAADVESYVVAGEAGASSTSSPSDAARPTSDFFAGDRPDGPGVGSRWSFEPVFRTADAAAVAGAARGRAAASARHRTTVDTWLLPALRPGTVLRIEELPDGLVGGPHWVERVTHRIGPAGATTRCRLAEGGTAFDPLALLGSLAGTLGSLP